MGMKVKKRMGKRVGIIIGVILAVLTTACVIFSIYVGKQVAEGLLHMNEGNDTKGNSVKQLEIWGYDLNGFKEQYEPEMVVATAEDGNQVPMAVFADDTRENTAILVHGAGGDHVSMYPVAEIYLRNGWNVIAIDQRASGDSRSDKVSFGYFEKLDVKAAVQYAKDELLSQKVVLHGQSMGAATVALYAATENAGEKVDAVILDSCFDSMRSMFLGVWREMDTEGIPEDYVVACGDWYLKNFYGFGFDDADVCEKMKENHIDTLMLQMSQDVIVSDEKAQEMFANIVAEEKKICYFDSEHVKGIIDYPKEYENAVFSFLGE